MLQNRWDDVVTHMLVRCTVCGEVVHTERLTESLTEKIREFADPLCSRHKMERQAETISGRQRTAGRVPR